MLNVELIKKIKRIEITTGKIVNEIFAGEYKSVFKGRGVEFAEVREYHSGDDIRSIDWNVSARYGSLFVKKFIEERELTVILLVDISGSQLFGSKKSKIDVAAELAGVLGFSAMYNGDRIGLLLFSDIVNKFVPPAKGKKHCLRIIREVLSADAGAGTRIKTALEYLNRLVRKKAVVFLISDFFDTDFDHLLRVTAGRHDLILVNVGDPLEHTMPGYGIFHFYDAESKKEIYVDSRNYSFVRHMENERQMRESYIKKVTSSMGIDKLDIRTDISYVLPLIRFFKMRERRFR